MNKDMIDAKIFDTNVYISRSLTIKSIGFLVLVLHFIAVYLKFPNYVKHFL